MKKDDLVFVRHILDSMNRIDSFSKGVSKKEFLANEEKQSAIVRQIEIIGEAVKNLSEHFRKRHPNIPWKYIAGTRDKIIHHYFGIDLDAIWDIVKWDLPKLKRDVINILKIE